MYGMLVCNKTTSSPLSRSKSLWPPAADLRFPSRIPPTRARNPTTYGSRRTSSSTLLPAFGYLSFLHSATMLVGQITLAAGMEAGMVKAMVLGGTAGERGVASATRGWATLIHAAHVACIEPVVAFALRVFACGNVRL